MMRIAIGQINPTVGDLQGNAKKILEYVALAKEKQADIVVFPELSLCGYPPEDLLYKEHFISDCLSTLRSLAKKVNGITAIIGTVDVDKEKNLYNAAAVVANGRVQGMYHKKELPNYGVFDEKRYFTPGKNGGLFSLNGCLLGVNICEDIWVAQGVVEEQVKKGAGLIINISSSPYDVGKLRLREKILKDRAVKTKSHICYANLVGGQDELVFDGNSLIYGPRGRIVAEGRQFEEDLLLADLDVPVNKKRGKDVIYLSSSRAGIKQGLRKQKTVRYGHIEQVFRALITGTRDYIRKNGFEKVLIGLSGGIDSSLVAVIAVQAVGRENVVGVTMPSRYTSKETKADAQQTAKNLGIDLLEVPIQGVFEKYLETLQPVFGNTTPGLTEENIQARVRGNILMAISNKYGWLVLTTGNKSELAVGYCTLYGDMSGGFAVIKDVPKTKVYELARFINKTVEVIPESVIARPPSAELRDNQKDEDSLPPYPVLDELLYKYVELHKPIVRNATGRSKDLGKEVVRLVDRSEYKRRQSPPGVKITPRAFGKDWRLPITNKYSEF